MGGGVVTKNQYRGGRLPKEGGLGLFANLMWDLARKKGGLRPQLTLWKYLWKHFEEYCCTCDGTTTFPKEI